MLNVQMLLALHIMHMYAFMQTEKRVETKCDRVRKLSAYLHVGEDPGLLVETELGGGLDGDPGDGSVVVQEVTQQLLAGAHLQRGGGGGGGRHGAGACHGCHVLVAGARLCLGNT